MENTSHINIIDNSSPKQQRREDLPGAEKRLEMKKDQIKENLISKRVINEKTEAKSDNNNSNEDTEEEESSYDEDNEESTKNKESESSNTSEDKDSEESKDKTLKEVKVREDKCKSNSNSNNNISNNNSNNIINSNNKELINNQTFDTNSTYPSTHNPIYKTNCWFFTRGHCRNGNLCRWLHILEEKRQR